MKVVELGSVATIDRNGVDPSSVAPDTIYLGLEHIERGGRIIGHGTVGGAKLASTKFEFTPEHLLFGKLRPNLGKVSRPGFSGVCSTDILPIRPGKDLDRNYLAHYLAQPSMVDFAASRTSGANLPRLSPTVLARFPVPLPSLREQRRIAAILDHADAVRAMRQRALAHLDALTRAIFRDMFGGRDDPLRRLRELVNSDDKLNYGVVQPGHDVPGGVPLIRVSNLRGGVVDRSDLKHIAPEVESPYARSRIKGNEVLVSSVGSIGSVSLVGRDDVGSNIARAITRIPISDPVLRAYVAAYLRTERPQRYFASEVRTVAQPTLNVGQLAETEVPLPPADMQYKFGQRADAVRRQQSRIIMALRLDDGLFAALQSRAFRGEL